MALNDFRAIYLPYCLEKQEDGSWVVLNREYKPVGFNTRNYITYSEFPISVKLKGLGEKTLSQLSYTGVVEGSRVHLYNDSSNPSRSSANMKSYLSKLEILAGLQSV